MFTHQNISFEILKERAFNLRWAAVPLDVIPLTAADPDFPCPQPIADAICAFANQRYFSYGSPTGMKEFKESASRFFQTKRNFVVSPDHILPLDSAAFGIYLVCKSFLQPGEEAIIFDPVDFLFRYSIEQVGGIALPFAIPPGTHDVDFSVMESLITPKTKMVCLCNPLNPTGKVFTKKELLTLAALAEKHNLLILSDEIWSDIVFAPSEYTSMAALGEEVSSRTVTVTGFSKSYGLAGLRMGLVATRNTTLFNSLYEHSLHASTIHGANILSQVAATAALDHCGEWLRAFVHHLHEMRDLCIGRLQKLPGVECIAPDGCYVAFANIKNTGKSSTEIHQLLMDEARVAVVPGLPQWFGNGAEGYIRLSFATSAEVLNEACNRIEKVII